ncbi:MAG: putative Ig domain-containing protein [Nitrospirae bacterium]|nr:putative Ig domain-containing protein [Nitrospirota bacterium]
MKDDVAALGNMNLRVRLAFPPSVVIVEMPDSSIPSVTQLPFVRLVSRQKVNSASFPSEEPSFYDAVRFWNLRFDKGAVREKSGTVEPRAEIRDDLIMPSDLPMDREERKLKDREYHERWKVRKNEEKIRGRSGRSGFRKSSSPAQDAPSSGGGGIYYASGSGAQTFGSAYGAGYYDTSLYMAGKVAVGVFFTAGDAGSWTQSETDSAYLAICNALDRFGDDEPNARLTFSFVKEVSQTGTPNPLPSVERDYVNDLRNTHSTHWALMVKVTRGSGRAYAYLFGPSLQVYSPSGTVDDYTVRHETMHIFGAMDQYCPDQCQSPIGRWGYLNVVNANSEGNDGNGFFLGHGEGEPDIMVRGGAIGVYSRGQIGWRDSDGNGIIDPIDTFPVTVISPVSGGDPTTITGVSTERPLLNEWSSSSYADVSINSISSVEYRIDGGAWMLATASDGQFDSAEESFVITLPQLSPGTHTIEARAANSIGNTEHLPASTDIQITAGFIGGSQQSGISAGTPVLRAAFSAAPENRHGYAYGYSYNFDASGSTDASGQSGSLSYRWDFDDDGVWDTGYSGTPITDHYYPSPEGYPYVGAFNAGDSVEGVFASGSYAYIANGYSGFRVVDISNPASPSALGSYSTSGYARGVFVSNNMAYLADGAVKILNVANPASPAYFGTYNSYGSARDVVVSGSRAYVASGWFEIADVSNPASPSLVGLYDTPGYARGVSVFGGYAYVADSSSGVQVVSLADEAHPVSVASIPGYAYAVYAYANRLYIAAGTNGLLVYDVTAPPSPVLLGQYSRGETAVSVHVDGNLAFIGDVHSGMSVVDVTNPSSPVFIDSYRTSGSATVNDVFASSGLAFVANGSSGLMHIIDTVSLAPKNISEHMRARLEIKDLGGNTSQAVRDLWFVTYNDLPAITSLAVTRHAGLSLAGSYDGSTTRDIAMSGNDALVAEGASGMSVYNLTDVSKPVKSASLALPGWSEGINLSGDYAYVASGASGLSVVDVRNHAAPVIAGSVDTPGYATRVSVASGYAYVADGASGLQVINVGNPQSPVLAAAYNTGGSAQDVVVSGGYAFVASGSSGLVVVDISSPQNPQPVAAYDTPGYAYAVTLSGGYAYVADGSSGLQIIDVSDPRNPVLVGAYDTVGTAMDVSVSGLHAYLADYEAGLVKIDVSDPYVPALVNLYAITGYARSVMASGGYAIVTDGGLRIFDVNKTSLRFECAATDPDSQSTWDGLKEHRFDYDNDGSWDTRFSSSGTSTFKPDRPLEAGRSYSGVCEVKDRFGATARQAVSYMLPSSEPLNITSSGTSRATVGSYYSLSPSISGGAAPYSWRLASGRLPAGLNIDLATGIIAGVPSETGSYRVIVGVSDAQAGADTKTLVLRVYGPYLRVGNAVADETDGTAYVNVTLDEQYFNPVTVDWTTAGGSASSGNDFLASGGTLVFAPGETAKTIDVPLVDDQVYEGDETFGVTLSTPSGGGVIATASGMVTIKDEECMSSNSCSQGKYCLKAQEYCGSMGVCTQRIFGNSLPDVHVESIFMPSASSTGQTDDCSVVVEETQGVGLPEDFSVRIYLSTDAVISGDDVLVKEIGFSRHDGGVRRTWHGVVTMPPDLPPGTYYPIAIIDPENRISEANEANNMLVCGSVSVSMGAMASNTIELARAVYSRSESMLSVRAYSGYGTNASLSVAGFGAMTWDGVKKRWTLRSNGIVESALPATITVSGPEGAASGNIIVR